MSLREGLHVMMQCILRQLVADRYWLHEHTGGHASWRESTMLKFTKESTSYFIGRTCFSDGMFRSCDQNRLSYFEEHAQEVWERNWVNPEMQTTLLNTYPPKLIATILKALREQLKENDQLNAVEEIAGPVPEVPLEYDQILKGGERFYLLEDLVLAARREEIAWVHSEGVYGIVQTQESKDADMKPVDLIWVDTDMSVDPTHKKIRSRLTRRRSNVRFKELHPLLSCSLQCHFLKR